MSEEDRQNLGKYASIINLPHHESSRRPRMSMYDRAAQFSPFAALTGYESRLKETERITENKVELCEDELAILDERLAKLQQLAYKPTVSVTHFVADESKSGGAYVKHRGIVRKVDTFSRQLLFEDGMAVAIDDVLELDIMPEEMD